MDNQYNNFENNGQQGNNGGFDNPSLGGYCTPNRGPVKMGQRPPMNRGFNGMGQRPPMGRPNTVGNIQDQNPMNQDQFNDEQFDDGMFNGNQFGNPQGNMNNNFNPGGNIRQKQNFASSYVGTPLDKKGKLGVNFVILGIIAWLMVAGQLTTGLIIFALLCVFIEQDENLTKVMMSAVTFFVTAYMIISGWTVVYNVLYYIVSGAASSSSWLSFMFNAATSIQGGLNSLNGLISRVYDIVVFVIGIKSALAISHGQITESKLANKIFKIQVN